MSVENAKAFIAKVKVDAGLRADYEAAEDEDGRAAVRTNAGLSCSVEDFKQAFSDLSAEELSEDDLNLVSGGGCGFHLGGGDCNTKFW